MICFHLIFLNFQTLLNVAVVTVKLIYHKIMPNHGSDGTANSVDPNQTAPVKKSRSGSAQFAQMPLSKNLGI